MDIEMNLQSTIYIRALRPSLKNFFKFMAKRAFSSCNELVSIPNIQDAMLSSV